MSAHTRDRGGDGAALLNARSLREVASDAIPSSIAGLGALYIHIPFCVRKCAYCDFTSWATRPGDSRMADYVNGLVSSLRLLGENGFLGGCRTAYIGGGTPTLLGPNLLGDLIASVREQCPRIGELTFEANPDSLSDEVLRAAVSAGATRVSIGVQSLDDAELEALGRIHDAALAANRVRAAVASGLDASVDLMCAIPRQTDASWRATLEGVLDLGVCHVSVYPLAIEEGTPFERRYEDEPTPWNDEDVQAERMEMAERVLEERGFSRYEVASYARAGKTCAHNTAYWTGVPYLGLGHGAASMLDRATYEDLQKTWPRLPQVPKDAARLRFVLPELEIESLSERQAWAEDLMLGMRLTRGVDLCRVPQPTAAELMERGLAREEKGRLVPTHDGWLLGNELFGTLWALAECPKKM